MNRRGRAMDANESQTVLLETDNKKHLVSWFHPFGREMLHAIETGNKFVIMDGILFSVRKCRDGIDYVFSAHNAFTPMTRISADNIRARHAGS